jgi:hypothetical protein
MCLTEIAYRRAFFASDRFWLDQGEPAAMSPEPATLPFHLLTERLRGKIHAQAAFAIATCINPHGRENQ